MISYTGEECIACKEKFKASDDIVVCPECGTPYHRNCWKDKGGCTNAELHKSGGSWMSNLREKKIREHAVRKACPECAYLNPQDAEKCGNCGSDLTGKECRIVDLADKNVVRIVLDSEADYFSMNPMELMDKESGITIGEMGDYAKENKEYFMHMFRMIRRSSAKLSFNIAAFIFPEFYFVYRRMYFQGIIIFILRFLLNIPLYLDYISNIDPSVLRVSAQMRSEFQNLVISASMHTFSSDIINITLFFDLILRNIVCVNANRMYFRHTVKRLKLLRKKSLDYIIYRRNIKLSGGVNIAAVISMAFSKIVFICVLLIILLI